MKKQLSEEQIIGFLREVEAGLPIKELCRMQGFSDVFYSSSVSASPCRCPRVPITSGQSIA